MMAAPQVSYQWRLREVIAAHGLFNATDLVPMLAERHHLVLGAGVEAGHPDTATPPRISPTATSAARACGPLSTSAAAAPGAPPSGHCPAAAANPAATVLWLSKLHIRVLVTGLATGRIPLTHQALGAARTGNPRSTCGTSSSAAAPCLPPTGSSPATKAG